MIKRLFIAFAIFALSACEKVPTENSEEEKPTKEHIEIYLSSQAIDIDNSESTQFKVMLNDTEDISDKAQIIDITGGGYNPLKSLYFTTLRPGIHTFFATYGDLTSSQISLTANSESNLSSTYYRRNVLFKFTGTWCGYCPAMSNAIDLAKYKYPDRLIEIAVHCNDDLATDAGNSFASFFKIPGYPTVILDMDKEHTITTSSPNIIINNAEQSLEENPTVAGIELTTSIKDNKLSIDIEATFTEDGNYRIAAAMLQSGFNYDQMGATSDAYRQNHVLRGFFQSDVLGDSIGERVAEERYIQHYDYEIPSTVTEEELARTTIVAYILKSQDDATYTINNAAECAIGESKPYQFEPIITE